MASNLLFEYGWHSFERPQHLRFIRHPVKLNIGILGTGGIANDQHAPTLSSLENAQFWSVLSRDIERAEAFAERHRAVAARPAFTDLDEMLADPDLDAIIIATPDRLHADQTIAAARAGKHVITEKPMATSSKKPAR